jgi:hypothetical protein
MFQVVGQRLEGNTGAAKDRLTTEDSWILDDDHRVDPHKAKILLIPYYYLNPVPSVGNPVIVHNALAS